jgi:hypothetical protein
MKVTTKMLEMPESIMLLANSHFTAAPPRNAR